MKNRCHHIGVQFLEIPYLGIDIIDNVDKFLQVVGVEDLYSYLYHVFHTVTRTDSISLILRSYIILVLLFGYIVCAFDMILTSSLQLARMLLLKYENIYSGHDVSKSKLYFVTSSPNFSLSSCDIFALLVKT